MKRMIVGAFLSLMSMTSLAQHGHHMHRYHGHNSYSDWIAPLVIGGVVGVIIANNSPQPNYNQYPVQSNAVVINGQIYTKQLMYVNGEYREVLVKQ